MSDVTIPAEDAKRLADVLRHRTTDPGREERLRWADLLREERKANEARG